MSKYTPGPWRYKESDVSGISYIIASEPYPIGCIYKIGSKAHAANARLIASAPEMLGTLQDVASYLLSSNDNADVIKMVEDARDVVKKATGEGMG